MRQDVIEEFNEWWFTGAVPEDLSQEYRRRLFYTLEKSLDSRFMVATVGLRRVGKTTLMYQLIQELLQRGVAPKHVLYFSFDEAVEGLHELLEAYQVQNQIDFRSQRIYIFLDEIQKLPGWQSQVKRHYDLYPKMKFFLSGSESLFLRQGIEESLAGRIQEYVLPPLSFGEFLELKEGRSPKDLQTVKIKTHFREYILKGGFPELTAEKGTDVQSYIRSIVLDKVIYKDIMTLSNLRDSRLLLTLLELIAVNPGMYVNYQSLGQQFDCDRRTIKQYIHWLEKSFLVRLLSNYRKASAARLRKDKKAYVSDTGIASCYKTNIDEAFFGRLVETAVINSIQTDYFWKNGKDVDAVADGRPIEVKYQPKTTAHDLRGLRSFMRKFKVDEGYLVTKDEEKTTPVPEGRIDHISARKFLLQRDVQ
ncbi:MAG: ATP-binding protein [Candidatus Altiarchaeota archaeon]